jgi:Tol biopolymer transport system component
MNRVWLALVGGLLLAAPGCQFLGVSRGELPEDPIAFIHHPEDQARRRAEAVVARNALVSRGGGENSSVVHLNTFHDYLTQAFGHRGQDAYSGWLALLSPRSRQVTVLESVQRGAIPLDWSPAHDRLLFAQRDQERLQIFEFDRRSRRVSQLSRGPEQHPQGCYGPEGRLVALVVGRPKSRESRAAESELVSHVAIRDSAGAFEAISAGPTDGEPACSPDGRTVAYVRLSPESGSEIWVHSFEGDSPSRSVARGREPSFSPDGEWIVYSHRVGKTPTLWRVRRDGTGRTRLGRGSGAKEYGPAVSPNGSLVVYESVFENRYRLFVRRFDGTGDRVLFSDGDGNHAVW